jgi:hypothetical protein
MATLTKKFQNFLLGGDYEEMCQEHRLNPDSGCSTCFAIEELYRGRNKMHAALAKLAGLRGYGCLKERTRPKVIIARKRTEEKRP